MGKQKQHTPALYTKGEERLNMITHIVGGGIGVAVLVLCVVFSAVFSDGWALGGSIVFGISMIIIYTMSAIYHGLRPGTGKRVMRILDHCTIYLLIAGTYTPILLTAIRKEAPVLAFVMFGIEWGVAALAITLTAIDLKKYTVFSMICYLVLGWGIMVQPVTVYRALTPPGFFLILAGGIAYTIGSILYGIGKKKKYIHGVFHIFCLVGSVLQFLAVLLYCIRG